MRAQSYPHYMTIIISHNLTASVNINNQYSGLTTYKKSNQLIHEEHCHDIKNWDKQKNAKFKQKRTQGANVAKGTFPETSSTMLNIYLKTRKEKTNCKLSSHMMCAWQTHQTFGIQEYPLKERRMKNQIAKVLDKADGDCSC